MGSVRWGFLFANVMFFVAFFSMVKVVFSFSGLSFIVTLSFTLFMMLFSFLALVAIARDAKWGWTLTMPSTIILLLFALLIYFNAGLSDYLETMIVSLIILFVLSIINVRLLPEEECSPQVEVYEDELEKVEPPTPVKKSAPKKAAKKPRKKKTSKKKKK